MVKQGNIEVWFGKQIKSGYYVPTSCLNLEIWGHGRIIHGLCTQNSYTLDKNSVTDNFNLIGEGP